MDTRAATLSANTVTLPAIWRVIRASAAGTMIEWYDPPGQSLDHKRKERLRP